MSGAVRHNSALKPILSCHEKIYCVVWLTLCALKSVHRYSGEEGGYLFGPTGVLSIWLRSQGDAYAVCSLEGIVWPWLHRCFSSPRLIGYQNENACICLGQCKENETFLLHSPCEPVANYTQGCRETLEPREATPAAQPARYLLCSVSAPLTGYIKWREARAGSCLLFLSHTHHSKTLSYYKSIQENSPEVSSTTRTLISSAALHDQKEVPG